MGRKRFKLWRSGARVLIAAACVPACAKLVGADFDDLSPAADASAGAGGVSGSGGTAGTSGAGGSGGSSGFGGSGGTSDGGPDSSAGGTSGTGGTSGSGGSAGVGGTAGSSGLGGTAGNGGSAGTGGTAGTSGSGGTSGSAGTSGSGGTAGTGGTAGIGGTAGTGGTTCITSPGDAGATTDVDRVVINEIQGQGNETDPPEDYVELFNTSTNPVDLSGLRVGDGPDDAGNFACDNEYALFPAGTIIPPGGYLIVLPNKPARSGAKCCSDGTTPCFDAEFGINKGGESIYLCRSDRTIVSSLRYPSGASNTRSYGRLPDGAESFGFMPFTPGTSNQTP